MRNLKGKNQNLSYFKYDYLIVYLFVIKMSEDRKLFVIIYKQKCTRLLFTFVGASGLTEEVQLKSVDLKMTSGFRV